MITLYGITRSRAARCMWMLEELGLLYERLGDLATARLHYNRVIVGYPDSDEALLAREKLRTP